MISPTAISEPEPAEVIPRTKPTNPPRTIAEILCRRSSTNDSRSFSTTFGRKRARASVATPVNSSAAATMFSTVTSNPLPAAERIRSSTHTPLTPPQHLADFRPGEEYPVLRPRRRRLVRRHPATDLAPERVLELERLDPELARLELLEDLLRVVGSVPVANAGVVAPDDEVGASVVRAHECVKNCLARPGVAHGGGVDPKQYALGRLVVLA